LSLIHSRGVNALVNEAKGRLFRRRDGKYLIYLPKDLAEDSSFPFQSFDSIYVKVSFKQNGPLVVTKWRDITDLGNLEQDLPSTIVDIGLTHEKACELATELERKIGNQLSEIWGVKPNTETIRMFSNTALVLTQAIISKMARGAGNRRFGYIE
jgi:hypothetical protein